jgi:hypothetical protein
VVNDLIDLETSRDLEPYITHTPNPSRPRLILTMTTTWASSASIRHPWFQMSSRKRKADLTVEHSASRRPSSPHPRSKRRRHDSLEHGFAELSLEHTLPTPLSTYHPRSATYAEPFAHLSAAQSSRTAPAPSAFSPSFLTSSSHMHKPIPVVPEPTREEPTRDVKMSTSSWYEPEKDRASFPYPHCRQIYI